MKTCPECGSVLADNEPYCENCGFDPDFDPGSWRYTSTYSKKQYIHGEHVNASPYVISKEVDWIFFILVLFLLAFLVLFYLLWH